ncbi:MAG: 2,3-bisphosphoglycerate-dependent phosphoglycerate mutase, partial [Steroidobacteraceae bacterium]
MVSARLVLVRHGQSVWNVANLFTGWADVDLSDKGCEEARQAGRELTRAAIVPDVVFTSLLTRAIRTQWLMLDQMNLLWLPVTRSWRLNERHYGALQGLNKAQTVERHGEAQVKIWRRSYDIAPPPMALDDERHPRFDRRYADVDPQLLPATESLKDTLARVLPYWDQSIVPQLQRGAQVLMVAHGNSLRALVKMLD